MQLGDGAVAEGTWPKLEGILVIVSGKPHEEHAVRIRFDIDDEQRFDGLGEPSDRECMPFVWMQKDSMALASSRESASQK